MYWKVCASVSVCPSVGVYAGYITLMTSFLCFFSQILTIAVLVILITAPIGAVAITLSGPKLLAKSITCISDVNISASESSIPNTKPDEAEKVV